MRKLLIISLGLILSACSSGTKKPSKADLDFVQYKHADTDRLAKASQCPNSTKSWAKSNMKTVLDLANSCVKDKDWKMLSALGEHLALELPLKPWGAYYMSLAAEGQMQMPRALWMAKLAVKKAPALNILHYHKGRIEWALGDGNAAIESMKSALNLDPNFVEANFFLANIHFQDQDFKSSRDYFEKVVKSDGGHSQALIGLGESYYKLGDKSDAKKYYEIAINKAPLNLGLRLKLADLYEGNKNYEQALYHYKKAQGMKPRGPASAKFSDLSLKIRELEKQIVKTEKKKVSKTAGTNKGGV